MRPAEEGFLLLTCPLGDPDRPVLTTAQFRVLASRVERLEKPVEQRDLTIDDILALGYGADFASRVIGLLAEQDVLENYLRLSIKAGCWCISRITEGYPLRLRKRLGLDCPGSLWARGDLSLLNTPMVALVGSRDLHAENADFAVRLGREAARQGYTLVSGNARGADRTAQDACLQAGGKVISVVADELEKWPVKDNILYLSENGFDLPFSAQRAISRNRVIHALCDKTFVAQVTDGRGGTWDGSVKNLRFGWSDLYCFRDGSAGINRLIQMGATPVSLTELADFTKLLPNTVSLFDQ